jgi:hypothetical protein
MKYLRVTLAAGLLLATISSSAPADSFQDTPQPSEASHLAGSHGFDFEIGEWRVHHHVKRPAGNDWSEFDGTSSVRTLMDGSANVEDNTFNKPDGITHGVAVRAYDQKTGLWAIWWIDGRDPHGALDPPVKGRFEDGVGTFYSDSTINGKPVRTRFIWSHITPTSARWEQALSSDAGKTWETNWTMDFRRAP